MDVAESHIQGVHASSVGAFASTLTGRIIPMIIVSPVGFGLVCLCGLWFVLGPSPTTATALFQAASRHGPACRAPTLDYRNRSAGAVICIRIQLYICKSGHSGLVVTGAVKPYQLGGIRAVSGVRCDVWVIVRCGHARNARAPVYWSVASPRRGEHSAPYCMVLLLVYKFDVRTAVQLRCGACACACM